ncbi:transmembrane protein 272-like [Branchiostoma floridae]|uniref:Transmembrane protein 272-like n=2 Tax=Branchiostoma floridae TaxID=7739 RepID=A0A9J7LQW9_BRAFL|nr:transmembrane protein 272-like [Branchiostoma floridae]
MSTEKDVEALASNFDTEEPPSYGTVDNKTDAGPPSYSSLYGEIKKASEESDGNVDFAKKASALIAGSVGCTIGIGFMLALPIAYIVIGAVYLHDCTIQRMIPIYLIVMGSFSAAKNIMSLGERFRNHRENETEKNAKPNPLDGLLGCFILAWFIAGNVWIYSVYTTVNMKDATDANYCQPTLYLFAFWATTVTYIFLGVMMCCCCCAAVVFGSAAARSEQS